MFHNLLLAALFGSYMQQLASAQLSFTGSLVPQGTESSGIVLVTIENTSTGNYSIEARNNLFDDANPYRPLTVKNLAGQAVTLVGTEATYGQLTDSAFVSMGPGAVWQKELNMTEYIPPDPTATKVASQCFSVSFPDGLFAVNTTGFVSDENLATGFLKGDSTEVFVEGSPLHLNVTVTPGKQAYAAATSATVGMQEPATLIQGTATGVGGAQATVGNSIDDYLGGAAGIFAKEQAAKPSRH